MIKRILLIIAMLTVTAYLAVAFTMLNRAPEGKTCERVDIVMEDSAGTCFITSREVTSILRKKGLYPKGLLLDSLKSKRIEEVLEENIFIENAECYKTPAGNLCISIRQRLPVLRVITSADNYYVDDKGRTMPGMGSTAHLPVATGHIDKAFAENELYRFALLIRDDPFWDKQIEQINVTADKELELVPRVGDHILFLGRPVNLQQKLDRLYEFYGKGLSRVGWNRYSRISVEFDNQVICKRKE